MFDTENALIVGIEQNPNQVWLGLDSFWRTQVVQSDADLVRYQTYATLVTYMATLSSLQNFRDAQSIATLRPFAVVPWYPIIIFEDHLINLSYPLYGGGAHYSAVPEIFYGQTGADLFEYPLVPQFNSITTLYDSITETEHVLDNSKFSYTADTRTINFLVNPFTYLNVRTTPSGERYIILWARNPELDLGVPFDWTGWLLKYQEPSSQAYVESLRNLYSLDVKGPSILSFKEGLSVAAGFPVAKAPEIVRSVVDDGYQNAVITDTMVYHAPLTVNVITPPGTLLKVGEPITDGIKFFDGYLAIAAASSTDVPGLIFRVPLSTGRVAQLFFLNATEQWSYNALRPSPYRFPVGGDPADVEQYWVDRNVNFITYYPSITPGANVNPMQLIVGDLIKNGIYIAAMNLSNLTETAAGFADRALLALPQESYIVIQQAVVSSPVADDLNLGTDTAEHVGYGYSAGPATDVASTSGASLVYLDYTPLVAVW